MVVTESYREHVLERLGRVAPVHWRRMFGEVGVYSGELFFAVIAEDRLYFKVDDATRPAYEERGMEPFAPMGTPMSYYAVPEDALDDTGELAAWMRAALEVAGRARRKRKPRRPGRKRRDG